MKRPRILIVDDESYIREFLAQILSEFFHVTLAQSGAEALRLLNEDSYSLVVLDIMMAGLDGIETCRQLRQTVSAPDIPVLMLTAVNDPNRRIEAFNAGVDDWVVKPFLPEELVARIQRKLSAKVTSKILPTSNGFQFGNFQLKYDTMSLNIDGVSTALGQLEFKILNYLLKNRDQLVERRELNDYVWGGDLPSERALDPHITSLRKKLEKSHGELKTVYGRGYSIVFKDVGGV